jgi:hypothetical protein
MISYHKYGTLDPFPIKFTLNNVGVDVTLQAGDVKVSVDGAAPANVNALPVAIDATNMPGVFLWTPIAAEVQGKLIVLNIVDQAGGAFDENMITIPTGGNASARYNG